MCRLMNFETALVHGLIWALMWGITVTFIEIKWPHVFLHDYPKELQEVINLPQFTNKIAAYIFETIMMLLIIAFIFWSGIYTYHASTVGYWIIFYHILVVCLCWNIFDLLWTGLSFVLGNQSLLYFLVVREIKHIKIINTILSVF